MMMSRIKSRQLILTFFGLLIFLQMALAQQPNRVRLIKALKSCEQDVQKSKEQIQKLSSALKNSDALLDSYKSVNDSLMANLKQRLFLQDSITWLMQTNADTLQKMVQDYSKKLNEVDQLYVRELKKRTRPWFFTGNGLKGLLYGVFIGGTLGITWALVH